MRDRIKRIFSHDRYGIDVIFMRNRGFNPSFFYATGLSKGVFEDSIALVWRDGYIDLLITELDPPVNSDYINMHRVRNAKDVDNFIKSELSNVKWVGIDGEHTSYSDYIKFKKIYPNNEIKDITKALRYARLTKDHREIERITKACNVVDKVMSDIPEMVHEDISEKELKVEIECRMIEYGSDEKAFDTIVAFGKNSSIPHYVNGDRKLRRGDIILVDFGAVVDGYVSDISRTFVFGRANSVQKRMYEVVLQAQRIGVESIKKDVSFESVHRAVKKYIDETEFKGRFIHSTGHTIGLEVHDGFVLTSGVKEKFLDGVTFTIEPGVYLSRVGGVRIEDDFIIKNGRVVELTSSPKYFQI